MYLLGLLIFIGILVLSYSGVTLFKRWSLSRKILDHPNERSSHSEPVPRGGGVVIVVLSLAAYLCLGFWYNVDVSWGFFAGALLIAGVSWLDDLYSVAFGWRLAVQVIAAAVLVADRGPMVDANLGSEFGLVQIGGLGILITLAWLIWMTNAYNFMDGIDGLAALQGSVAAVAWAAVGAIYDMPFIYLFAGVIAAACVGFLIHNWQPATIFMGDVGSAFLGFTLAAFPLLAPKGNVAGVHVLALAAIAFLWFFLFDTVLTMFRRLTRLEKIWQPHREHLYQRMIQGGLSHSSVTMLYGSFSAVISTAALTAVTFWKTSTYVLVSCIFVLSLAIVYMAAGKKILT